MTIGSGWGKSEGGRALRSTAELGLSMTWLCWDGRRGKRGVCFSAPATASMGEYGFMYRFRGHPPPNNLRLSASAFRHRPHLAITTTLWNLPMISAIHWPTWVSGPNGVLGYLPSTCIGFPNNTIVRFSLYTLTHIYILSFI